MPTYKLLYFDAMGYAELARLMFAEAGVEYEDKRFSREEWPSIKPDMPFEQVPVLFVDDKPLPQTGAIVRYLAREFKLAGESSLEQAYVDMLYETLREAASKLPFMVEDPEKKKEIAEEALNTKIYPVLEKVEKKVKEMKTEYLVGKSLTYVDILYMQMVPVLEMFGASVADKYPTLTEIAKRVQERPNIKKWMETRPKTTL